MNIKSDSAAAKQLGSLGGSRNTAAQREARARNAVKARAKLLEKRVNTVNIVEPK